MKDPLPTSPPAPSSHQPLEVPLDSWKEIANYIKRDVTTVQQWEKREGMPVHRHVHDKRGSVYAYGSELDVWLQSRQLRSEEEEQAHRSEPTDKTEGKHEPSGFLYARRWLALCGIAVFALAAVAYIATRTRVAGSTSSLKITSLAVLPLKNLSGDPAQEYFADGMTEEITDGHGSLTPSELRAIPWGGFYSSRATTMKPFANCEAIWRYATMMPRPTGLAGFWVSRSLQTVSRTKRFPCWKKRSLSASVIRL
jgi:hypothetical protein